MSIQNKLNKSTAYSYAYQSPKGLNKKIVEEISHKHNEPGWMTDLRLGALEIFESMPMPLWGADLSALNHQDIHYFTAPLDKQQRSWDDVPADIKSTFDALGIPQAEKDLLAGVGAQFESQVIYKSLKQKWVDQGVIFLDTNSALRDYPELFKKYFGTIIPAHDNKFAALNWAVWSGGSFIYIPRGVQVDMPLQTYFRINAQSMGQFERTLIIAEPGSSVHYIEGCSAPVYSNSSLHSAVVEIIAHEDSRVRYTTIQNWALNVYNLVTKRAIAHERARVEWVDGNFGSKVTMKYPAIILKGNGSKGQIISIAVAGNGQHQDSGGKIIHIGENTTSDIVAKSISKDGGRSSYRGLLKVVPAAHNVQAHVQCDALLFDTARSDTYPTVDVKNSTATIGHEASVSKVSQEQIFYAMSRGLRAAHAQALIVNGFLEPFTKELPLEYAVEINRLIAHEMEGSIG
ncbi:MAG: Fe-S cluster assembly protein SufB [Candidatus Babeliales bacterium]